MAPCMPMVCTPCVFLERKERNPWKSAHGVRVLGSWIVSVFFSLKKIFIYLFFKKQSTRLVILGGCAVCVRRLLCAVRCGVDVHVHWTCMVRSSMPDGSMYMSMVCTHCVFRDEKGNTWKSQECTWTWRSCSWLSGNFHIFLKNDFSFIFFKKQNTRTSTR
jgi:hypothetical protein